MGVWIAIAIGLFVLGSMMALKPSSVELRLDKLRMTARRLQLNPKLISCPDWIRGRDNEFGRGMMGQYSLILDNIKLPETRYIVINNELRPCIDKTDALDAANTPKVNASDKVVQITPTVVNHRLDGEPIDLPEAIAPLVKAVYSKANSLVVFWEDSSYVKPSSNPIYDSNMIEADLLAMKAKMHQWALKLVQKPPSMF